jgi:diguanylate cyclase (GGDEF)-like protein
VVDLLIAGVGMGVPIKPRSIPLRVLNCIIVEHDPWLVSLAALMCAVGAYVTVKLWRHSLTVDLGARFYWCFLSSVTTGAFVWVTHFIAMLGYRQGLPVAINGSLTIGSMLVIVVGSGIGLTLAALPNRRIADLAGGTMLGLSIAAMHYLGSIAYRIEGITHWDNRYILASIAFVVPLSIMALRSCRQRHFDGQPWRATAWLTAAVLSLHFLGMTAMTITPLSGVAGVVDIDVTQTLGMASVLVAVLIVGTGISIHLIEQRWQDSSNEQLQHIAGHDTLTGLANRRLFNEVLTRRCAGDENPGQRPFALLIVDLDRFKPVNDTFGHPVGDLVLIEVARRLTAAGADALQIARLGGDEFALLIECRDAASDEPETLSRAILAAIAPPIAIEEKRIDIGASIGFARAFPGETTPSRLTQQVDVALYEAKQRGRGRERYVSFAPELMRAIQARREIESDLRVTTAVHGFSAVYQPFVDRNGRYAGAEALARWDRSGVGPVSPTEFIPMAEQLGLISEIGRYMLIKAAQTAATWPAHLIVAVNLSPVQLRDPDLPEQVRRILAEAGLAPERLELEITETGLVGDNAEALRSLHALADMGITIALDDFGTGYSSLGHLHLLPIDRLKIDRSFTERLPGDDISAAIVHAVADLGLKLNLEITAEGIETEAQRRFMLDCGCTHLQGYVTGRPMRAEQISRLFAASGPLSQARTAA